MALALKGTIMSVYLSVLWGEAAMTLLPSLSMALEDSPLQPSPGGPSIGLEML